MDRTLVVFGFNAVQTANSQQLAAAQHNSDQQLQQKQFASSQQLQQDQQHQTVLTTYLDRMSGFLSALLTSHEGDGIRAVARAQSLAALQQLQLDSGRKRILLLFLYQAKLINVVNAQDVAHQESAIVSLSSADLTDVDLSGVDLHDIFLREVNLHGANLSKALLYESNLFGANLSGANLNGADLNGAYLDSANLHGAHLINAMMQGSFFKADLSGANLSGASLEGANLDQANLSGAILSGAKYNTKVVQKVVNGKLYPLPPTIWPTKGFDPAARGAIEDNTP